MIQEFMIATDMTSCGTPDEKLRWAFKMYDEDIVKSCQAWVHTMTRSKVSKSGP